MSTLISRECSHQHLIDARLDAIERILMSNGVPRSERREIVSAVEEQIWELLENREGETVTRAEVLRVLALIDPPEAYCSDDLPELPVRRRTAAGDNRPEEVRTELQRERFRSHRTAPLAIIALVLSLMSVPAVILMPLGATLALAGGICGIIAIWQVASSHGRLQGMWMNIVACVILGLHFAGVWVLLVLN